MSASPELMVTLRERIAPDLERRFGLAALWLFGSHAAGRARSDSDVDLAALFRRRPSPAELVDAAGAAEAVLGRPVDLISADEAAPILAMQVLRNGRLVVDADPVRRAAFTSAAFGRYEDLKIARRPAERALLRRIDGGRA